MMMSIFFSNLLLVPQIVLFIFFLAPQTNTANKSQMVSRCHSQHSDCVMLLCRAIQTPEARRLSPFSLTNTHQSPSSVLITQFIHDAHQNLTVIQIYFMLTLNFKLNYI